MAAQIKRTGGTALRLLSSPLNVRILQALEKEPLSPLDLRRAVGSPPESTMRVYSRTFVEAGVIERRRQETFPPSVDYVLTPAGEALLKVGNLLQAWLSAAPEGPILLGSPEAKSATRALVEGWSTNIIRALAARPYSLTELSKVNVHTSYPALDRRLGSMRLANQVEPQPGEGRGIPYRATRWLREAVTPLGVAVAWERKHLPATTAKIGRLDVESAFLLAIPLMELPERVSGKVRLVVELQGGSEPQLAGAAVEVVEGKIASCSVRLEGGRPDAWVVGPAAAWLRQMNGGSSTRLELGGDSHLAEVLLDALHAALAHSGAAGTG